RRKSFAMDAFLVTEALALFALAFPAALGVAIHKAPRTPYVMRLLGAVALAFAVSGLGLRLAGEVISREYQRHGSPPSFFYLPVGLAVSSAVFLLLGVLLTATCSAMALATAARRQAWDWLLLLTVGTVLPLLVALGLFLSSMQAYYR